MMLSPPTLQRGKGQLMWSSWDESWRIPPGKGHTVQYAAMRDHHTIGVHEARDVATLRFYPPRVHRTLSSPGS